MIRHLTILIAALSLYMCGIAEIAPAGAQERSGLQKSLADKLVEDMRATVDPKVKALATTIDKHLAVSGSAGKASEPARAAPKK